MSQKPSSLFYSLLTVLLFCVSLAWAATPTVHISAKPNWLNPCPQYDKGIAQRNIQNGFFYRLIEEQINIEKKAHYVHIERQIVSEAGIQNGSELNIGFDPSYERLDVHEIIIWRNNKPQRRLSASLFKVIADEKDLSKFIYQGTFSAYCILDDIRKGDRIEYSYTLTGRNPIIGDHFADNIYLQVSQPVAHLYTAIFAAPARKLYFKSFNKVPKTNTYAKNGLVCYEWENFQVPAAIDYENQPGWYTSYGYIQVTDYKSWAEVAEWGLKINPTRALTGKLAERVAAIKASTKNKEDYFRAAVKLVQDEVRYMGIEIGEYSHRANDPEKVYNQRYGDCKDKSLLLVSILDAAGIEANMALINTYANIKTDQYLPSPFAFNHAVVRAVINQMPVWVDATMAYQRGTGAKIYFPQYGQGLIVQPGSNAIVNIPPAKTGQITYLEEYYIPNDTSKVALDVRTVYSLNEADYMRNTLAGASMAETEKGYLDYYARIYPKIESADSIMVYDSEDANEITIIEHYLIPEFAAKMKEGNRLEAGFYANFISDQLVTTNVKNKYPRTVHFPCKIDYTIRVTMRSGWSVEEHSKEIKADAYNFQSHISAAKDTLVLNYRFSYLKNYIPVEQLDQYNADVKNIKDNELSYSFSYLPGDVSSSSYDTNYWMVLLVIAFGLAATGIFVYIYHGKTPEVVFEPGATFVPLGGWLILVGIGLAGSAIVIIRTLLSGSYFNVDLWQGLAGIKNGFFTKFLICFEVSFNVIFLCFNVFCLILLLNKRDILPKYIIRFYIGLATFIAVDAGGAYLINYNIETETIKDIVRNVVWTAIWVPYFRISSRVRETFIVPYPHSNYSYEEWGAVKKDADGNEQEVPVI
jgi:transglutaminase-like putative cysteine protease